MENACLGQAPPRERQLQNCPRLPRRSVNGIFPLPMKANRIWAWENHWLPFSFISLILFPGIIAYCTVPHLSAAWQQAHSANLIATMACGALV